MAYEAQKDINGFLTLKQASELLGLHPNTLRKWDKSGYLKAIRIGRRGDRRYRKSDVVKILEEGNK